MVDQTVVLKHIKRFQHFSDEYGIQGEVKEKILQLQKKMDQFSLKVLFIGGFSAGKSALLNRLLSEELLIENQTPETAVATELCYGPINKYEAVFSNGTVREMSLEEIQQHSPKEVQHFRFTLNNSFLRQYSDFTFVDMPGFNSTIEQHNKAIMQYIGQGNAYVMVVDCEEGEIKATGIDFIHEIRHYDHNLAIAVSKSDKKTPSALQEIVKNIKETAEWEFQEPIPVEAVGKFDEETFSKIERLVKSFDVQQIFHSTISPLIEELYEYIIISFKKLLSTQELDVSQLEQQIDTHVRLRKELELNLQKERKKLTQKMQNYVLPNIINDVETALFNNSYQLATAAKTGENAFSRQVNNILRPVLIEATRRYTEESYSDFLQELDFESLTLDTANIGESIQGKLKDTVSALEKIKKTISESSKTYKVITGVLAVTTGVVAPWLELVIIFLPDLIKLIGFGGEKNQTEKMKKKIENEVIPQIVGRLRPAILESLKEVEAELLEETETKMAEVISVEEDAIKSAQEMKQNETKRYENLQKNLKSAIAEIQLQLDELRSASYANKG